MRPSRKFLLATIILLIVAYFWTPFRWWNPVASIAIGAWFLFLVVDLFKKPKAEKSTRQRIEWIGLGGLVLILGVLLIPKSLPLVGWFFYGCIGLYLLLKGLR